MLIIIGWANHYEGILVEMLDNQYSFRFSQEEKRVAFINSLKDYKWAQIVSVPIHLNYQNQIVCVQLA